MDIQSSLHTIGLTPSEIKVYLYLLEHGLATPAQIAKGTGIMRTNTYNVLRSLLKNSLVLEQSKGARKVYFTNDPEALLLSLERKKETITKILPDLKGLHAVQKNKPKIRFFDGLKQIEEIYRQTLNSTEIYALGSPKRLHAVMPNFMRSWTNEVKRRGIILHDIIPQSSREDAQKEFKEVMKGLYDAKILSSKYADISTDLLLWDDNLALITLEEPFFGTILTNASLVRTFKIVLELLRERL